MLVALIRLDLNDDFDRVAWWMMRRVVECGRDSWFVFTFRWGGVQMEKHAGSFQFKQCEMLKSHLQNLGIEDCIAMLNAAHIDMELFKKMTEEDLLDAGIKAGPIRAIMNERNEVGDFTDLSHFITNHIHCGRCRFTHRSSATNH
jgi:hypothetical protein